MFLALVSSRLFWASEVGLEIQFLRVSCWMQTPLIGVQAEGASPGALLHPASAPPSELDFQQYLRRKITRRNTEPVHPLREVLRKRLELNRATDCGCGRSFEDYG